MVSANYSLTAFTIRIEIEKKITIIMTDKKIDMTRTCNRHVRPG